MLDPTDIKRTNIKKFREPKDEPMVDIWRYSSKNGKKAKITVIKCHALERDFYQSKSDSIYRYLRAQIQTSNGLRWISLQPEEGRIVQGTLWLRERDDDRAMSIFRQDALDRIDQLEKLISSRHRFIEQMHVEEG